MNSYFEGYNPLWEANTAKAFWCVLAIAILGLFGGIADTVLMATAVGQVASEVVGSDASLPVSGSLVMSVLLKVAMVVVFGLYVWALDGFARVQRRWEDARSVRQVKTAVIIQLICFILMMMIPLLLRISPGVLGLWIVVWIMALVSCFMMKDGFNNLKQSELLNQKAQLAAENLRYAAVCTLNLLIMPVVVAIILAVIGLLTLGSLDSIIGSFRYSGFGIDTLNSAGNTYNSAVDALQTAKVLGIFVLIASGLLGLYWGVVAFVYPMIGWYRMQHAGFLATKQDAVQAYTEALPQESSPDHDKKRLCAHCGSPIDNDAVFCTACGKKQDMEVSVSDESEQELLSERPLPLDEPHVSSVVSYSAEEETNGKGKLVAVVVALAVLLCGVGGYLYYDNVYLPAKIDREAPRFYTVANAVVLRSSKSAGADFNKVASLPYGTELITYEQDGEWSSVKANTTMVDGSQPKGFVASQFILNKPDFFLLNSIFGDQDSREVVFTTKCRQALLNYFKEHGFVGKIDDQMRQDAGIATIPDSDNQWQVFCRPKDVKPNNVLFKRLHDKNSKFTDFAVIIQNISNGERRLLYFYFNDDEQPYLWFEQGAPESGYIKDAVITRSGYLQAYYSY